MSININNNLYNKKWQKFLSRVWLFKFIPFVDFVFASGSLATKNIREESDFDVIVGVRQGRIFTVRMFCYLSFGMLGWWAKHPRPAEPGAAEGEPRQERETRSKGAAGKSKDRLCFNHFVTPNAYRLAPPHNEYWKKLYQSLVPVYGDPLVIQKFYDANADWTGTINISKYLNDYRYKYQKKVLIARKREWILSEKSGSNIRTKVNLGDWLEKKLKSIQIKKIEAGLKFKTTHAPRIIFNDNELEFHPHTKRIEEYIEKLNK